MSGLALGAGLAAGEPAEPVLLAGETAGRRGWPVLSEVVEHDARSCAGVRALLRREAEREGDRRP